MRRRLLCEQRGAISVLAGLSLVFVVAAAAFTVDLGQYSWKKRDLQKMVDVVSLDAVRAMGDRKDSVVDAYTKAVQFAQQAATRNGFDYTNTAAGHSLTVEIGIADATTKVFTVVGSSSYSEANAVRVTATSRSDNRFMPGNLGVTAQAVAMVDPIASFQIGSKLVSLDTTTSPLLNQVLKGMLGAGVNLTAVGYNGLAAGSVKLGDVWTQLGLGTTDQIMNSSVNYRNFLNAMVTVLNNQGDPSSVTAASYLGTLSAQVNSSTSFKFGDMLQVVSGDPGQAAAAKLDVLQMVGMAASVANGSNLLNMTLPITIPGVTTTTMKLGLIEKPKIATGPARKDSSGNWVTRAQTGQARLQLDLTLTQKLTVLLSQGTVHLPVYLEAAGAKGELTNIRCAIPATSGDITVRTTTQPVTAKVGTATDPSLTSPGVATVNPGQIVSMAGLVNVTGTATATMASSVQDLVIQLFQTLTAGSSSVSLAAQLVSNLALTVQVLGLGINATTVANNTLAILNPVLSTLDSTLLTPLKKALGSLGIAIGGADVTNLNQDCGYRRLIG
jgi:uncharacterized membrane protein